MYVLLVCAGLLVCAVHKPLVVAFLSCTISFLLCLFHVMVCFSNEIMFLFQRE